MHPVGDGHARPQDRVLRLCSEYSTPDAEAPEPAERDAEGGAVGDVDGEAQPVTAAVRRDEARDQPQLAMGSPGESADDRLGGDPCRRGDRPGGGCLKVTAHSANRRGAVLV